jgi:serine/threonine-protein kinase RsbW
LVLQLECELTIELGTFRVIAASYTASAYTPFANAWQSLKFSSTLFLQPILDRLLVDIPAAYQPPLRLGLQEALVNAAKHGNQLDPGKEISVHFTVDQDECWWVIADQGEGFSPTHLAQQDKPALPECESESGRGLYILYQIFDQVSWCPEGKQLRLCKRGKPGDAGWCCCD